MRAAEGDAWAGTLRVTFGTGTTATDFEVPVLTIAEARPWKAQVEAAMTEVGTVDFTKLDDVAAVAERAWGHVLGAVQAYDLHGVLPATEELEALATHAQVYETAREMFMATYPFVRDAKGLIAVLAQVQVAAAVPRNAPSAPEPSSRGRAATPGKRRGRSSSS